MLIKPTLVVLDGTQSMMRNGPTGGSLDDLNPTHTLIAGTDAVASFSANRLILESAVLEPNAPATGDYFVLGLDRTPMAITANSKKALTLVATSPDANPPRKRQGVQIAVRLQKPYVTPRQCIGCGVCEHECPVQGRRAISISAENASRHREHRILAN